MTAGLTAHLPILAVVVPLIVAPLVVLLRSEGLARAAALAASACTFAMTLQMAGLVRQGASLTYELGSWAAPYGIELLVDPFSAVLLVIVSGASTAGLLVAHRGLDTDVDVRRQPLYFAAWLLVLAGLSGVVVSADAFNIFVFLEISSLATYILVSGGRHRAALVATFRYLVLGTLGTTFYLIGIGLIYAMTGTLNLADMETHLQGVDDIKPVLVASGLITVGLALKAGIFPLHIWLPNAYAFSPHAATAFIAACSTKVALYVLLRFDFFIFQGNVPGHEAQFTGFVLPLAVITILVASILALHQRDLKRLLAYSSIAQMGIILTGAALSSAAGLTAGVAHMFNHALAKGTLFLAVACIGTRCASLSLDGIAGVAQRMPLTMAGFLVAALSLIGLPGTAGFVSKWYLALAALELGPAGALLIVPVLAGSVMTMIYLWKVIEPAYFDQLEAPAPREEAHWVLVATLWLGALANIYFGLQPGLVLEFSAAAAEALLAVSG